MREKTYFFIGFALSTPLAILGVLFSEKLWDIINSILLINIFLLQIQLYFHLKDGDPMFGKPLQRLRVDPLATRLTADLISALGDALHRQDAFLHGQILSFLNQAHAMGRRLHEGLLEIDFRPGGLFFREVDVVDHAKTSMRATSFADSAEYWPSAPGRQILAKNRQHIGAGAKVTRIFIEAPEHMNRLAKTLDENVEIGVNVRTVEVGTIPEAFMRDFAIIDDGHLAVELFLDERRPVRAVFYSASGEEGRRKIAELETVWTRLVACSTEYSHKN